MKIEELAQQTATDYTSSLYDLEEDIFHKEGIRVVIRAPKDTMCKPYRYTHPAIDSTMLTDLIRTRIRTRLPDEIMGCEIVTFDPRSFAPHPTTKIGNLRHAYKMTGG
jgi:hypothetical protein